MNRLIREQDKARGISQKPPTLPSGSMLGLAHYDLQKKEYQREFGTRIYSIPTDEPKQIVPLPLAPAVRMPAIPTVINPEGKHEQPERRLRREKKYLPGERLLKKLHKDYKKQREVVQSDDDTMDNDEPKTFEEYLSLRNKT